MNLAGSYFNTRQYDRAIAEYETVRKMDPENAQMFAGLGICYLRKGDLASAKAAFEHALQRDPTLVDPKTGLGIIHYTQRDYAKAAEYFEQTYPFRRESVQLADYMSDSYMRMGKYQQAVEILKHAGTLPNFPERLRDRLEQAERSVRKGN